MKTSTYVLAILVCLAGVSIAKPPAALNCKDPQSIRDFKDVILGKMRGVQPKNQQEASEWARAICGKAADAAGFNNPLPPEPRSVPMSPAVGDDWTRDHCAKVYADLYLKPNLPITEKQALKLGRYIWRDHPESKANQPEKKQP